MSERKQNFVRQWMDRAKDKFDMSGREVQAIMQKANIQNLDSKNDIATISRYLAANKPKPEPKPTPKPNPKDEARASGQVGPAYVTPDKTQGQVTSAVQPSPALGTTTREEYAAGGGGNIPARQPIIDRAVQQTGLSEASIRGIAADIGIANLDTNNDIRAIRNEIEKRETSRVESSPTYTSQVDQYNTLKDNFDKTTNDLTKYKGDYETLTSDYGDLERDYLDAQKDIEDFETNIGRYRDDISDYKDQISTFETDLAKYRTDYLGLSDKYQSALTGNQSLMRERDEAKRKFEEQSAAFEQAKGERDQYREAQVGAQLSGLRGGATVGGGNQSSYGTGGLASGRTGFSSSRKNRDQELADYFVQQGGATDSVLARDTPVVELMDRRRQGSGGASGQARSMTSGAGSGSYYASRFGG